MNGDDVNEKYGKRKSNIWKNNYVNNSFFNDNDYIERGYLEIGPSEKYYHSWIVFHFKDELFVFDPCLQYICPQKLYYQVFTISKHDILGTVTSKSVQ